ncbi:hypothetical protein BTO32_11500 [Marinobacter lutaoensis]|uniref:DUF669 domain-containing protein n=1 Tax=Marinobacter lutaoensis TaxID=135739 RepID=A0A1V2DSK9_9GAMM|nr:hypothetical protein [Marinobacter lutaoensis]ONF43301.1 hypothetical protein BTO32_11500 [Marinobacter lutaoensis]
MTTWNDFNSADDQNSFDLIPKGTRVKVRMTIRPGGYDDPSQGWTGGYATQNATTGSVYLNCEFVVLEGPYARRKMWSLIGLHSPKGPEWANMGRAFIKGILNSARGLHPQDNSPQAQQARRIQGFADLDGIEFVAKVELEKDQYGEDKNVVKTAITPDHKDYAAVMGQAPVSQGAAPAPARPATPTGRPSWAQ